MKMTPELRDFVSTHKFERVHIEKLAEMLPQDDGELDSLIAGVVDKSDWNAFTFLVTAALGAGRFVDGRHLREGTCLAPNGTYLGTFFWHMRGDSKFDSLVHALCKHKLATEIQLHGLLAAAGWCKTHLEGKWPDDLLRSCREIMRRKMSNDKPRHLLHALAAYIDDPDLIMLAHEHHGKIQLDDELHQCAVKVAEAHLAVYQLPVMGMVPSTIRSLGAGTHLRRSIPKISRNAPCHCGSGQKYKRCCHDKDQERAHSFSEVEGKTPAELEESREPHLTPDNIQKLSRAQVRKLDPMKISHDILPWYFLIIGTHGLFDEAASAFEKLGWLDHVTNFDAAWDNVVTFATWAGLPEVAERLIRARYPDGVVPEGVLKPGTELLRLHSCPDLYLAQLEKMALEALTCKESDRQQSLAYGLLSPLHPALSLLMVQGMLPVISKQKAFKLLEFMQKHRDQLLLPAEDPFTEILERRFMDAAQASHGKDAQKLREANDRLQVKSSQVNELRGQLETMRRELRLKEKAAKRETTAAAAPTSAELEALRELREKVERLKSTIQDHSQERAALRHDLASAYTELQELRRQKSAQHPAETSNDADDESLTLPATLEDAQPVRLIEYPKKFHATLSSLPKHVSRSAQVLLGRLSAGEPSAFVGIVALRARPDTLRLRVGADHRLVFRLHPASLEVLDLINRRDLDRLVKSL